MLADTAHLVISIMLGGVAVIFLLTDHRTPASRAIAYCLLSIASAMAFASADHISAATITAAALMQTFETLAILFGIEWGRLVSLGTSTQSRVTRATYWLFRCSQLIVLVFGALSIGYILIFPEYAVIDPEGLVKVRAVEFAVFAPLLGAASLLAGIAIVLLLLTPVDPVERIRLRAMTVAGPLFMLTLLVNEQYEPLIMAAGLVVFLGGSVHYLVVQSQRGTAMRQFVSPALANMVNQAGMDTAMHRERRQLSVVACDLRGFTAYARRTDSATVIALLEQYYALVGSIAARYEGTVKDHAGDGVLILVGAPQICAEHAQQAVRMALAIVEQSADLLLSSDAELGLGVGVATGEATVGAIRGAGRLEYVAVGNVVNLAARLCDRALNQEILLDEHSCRAANLEAATPSGTPELFKGYDAPVTVYSLKPTPDPIAAS